VRLPYAGGRLAMTVVVPTGRDTGYPAKIPAFHPAAVELWLPKFRFSWSHELTTALQALGMRAAFTGGADFSGITTAEPLQVSFVQHQAFIDVNENGTEAAAATAVGIVAGAALAPSTLVAVHADHPFYFAITDRQTGLVLFLGHIADPTAN
jgi:serpin B